MYKVNGTTIVLTRGDTFRAYISIKKSDGNDYVPAAGDSLRFALKRYPGSNDLLILKPIPLDTCLLQLDPEDTKNLPFGDYSYDIELDFANGDVDTIIPNSRFVVDKEVY